MLPIVGALLGQGLNLLANAALAKGKDWVEQKTGVKIPDGAMPPEVAAQLKIKEMEHEEELLKIRQEDNRLEAEIQKMYLADVQNARGMQTAALQQDDPMPKRFIYYLATGWSLFAMVYIFWITFADIPARNIRFADTILGFLLGTVIAMILQFFFGSSQGSVKSSQALRDIARGTNAPSK